MVSEVLSSNEGESEVEPPPSLKTYTDSFNEAFPYYLSIGMTYEQFWNEDCTLVEPYREADRLRTEKKNQEMWLQGAYFYDALCRVSPVLHAFAKKGTKPMPYMDEPYTVSEKQAEIKEERAEKKAFDKNKAIFEAFMTGFNQKFERSE